MAWASLGLTITASTRLSAELFELGLLLGGVVLGVHDDQPQVGVFGGRGLDVGLHLRPPRTVQARQTGRRSRALLRTLLRRRLAGRRPAATQQRHQGHEQKPAGTVKQLSKKAIRILGH